MSNHPAPIRIAALPVHPVTGLQAVGFWRGDRPIWPIRGAEDPPTGTPPAGDPPAPADAPKVGANGNAVGADGTDLGYPANTPVKEMSLEQQVAYERYQGRKHQERAEARKDFDAVKAERDALKSQMDALTRSTQTEHERDVTDKVAAARAEATKTAALGFAATAIRLAVGDRADQATLDGAIDELNLEKFLDSNGQVDMNRVVLAAGRIAPPTNGTPPRQQGPPAFPQGHHGGGQRTGSGEGGLAAAQARGFIPKTV